MKRNPIVIIEKMKKSFMDLKPFTIVILKLARYSDIEIGRNGKQKSQRYSI